MICWVVCARNPLISGIEVSLHFSKQSADREAARLTAMIRNDWYEKRIGDLDFGFRYGDKPRIPQPSPETYDEVINEMLRWDLQHGIDIASTDYGVKVESKPVVGLPS